MISPEVNTSVNLATAIKDCRDLTSACALKIDGSACDSTTYSDWRAPYREELYMFVNAGITVSGAMWTLTPRGSDTTSNDNVVVNLNNGGWATATTSTTSYNSICIR